MKGWPLGNLFHFPSVLFTVFNNIRRQKIFLRQVVGPDLESSRQSNDGSLDLIDYRKITHYYGLAVPAILGESLAVLRGQRLNLRERSALTFQGSFTGLFDDFFDKDELAETTLESFIDDPRKIPLSNSRQRLFAVFFNKGIENYRDKDLTLDYLRKVFHAQVESLKQAGVGLSRDEIRRITVEKGGVSVLFYRTVLDQPLNASEEKALYNMGGLMQFGNDIFDVYKDSLHEIETLITATTKVDVVRKEFEKMMVSSFAPFYELGYPRRNVKKFLRMVSLSLCARCFVCLDQLEKKENETGNVFLPKQYTRDELVCDMDKGINKWRSIKYYFRLKI